MRTDVAGVIIALVLAFAGMLSVCAQDAKVSEVRKVDAFSSIEITSVGTIHFTQSDTYSFRQGEVREEYADHSEGRPSADRFQGREKQAQEQSEGWRDYLDFGSRLEGGGVYRCRRIQM